MPGKIRASLADYPCGPTLHDWRPSGMLFGEGFDERGSLHTTHELQACAKCNRLEQRGVRCLFCEDPGSATNAVVVAPDTTQIEGPLCAECYLELLGGHDTTGYSMVNP